MQTSGLYNWIAEPSSAKHGYICQGKCRKGYHWHNLVNKCIMTKHDPNDELTLPGAMRACAESFGRLVTAKDCFELSTLKQSLMWKDNVPNDRQLTIGIFSKGLEKASRRRSSVDDQIIDS
jgi:hypothetical protein